MLKYKSCLTSVAIVAALHRKVKLAIQACGSDDFPFFRVAHGRPPFFFMYRCLFEVLGVIPPLTVFQCVLLEHLNVTPS